MSESCKSIGEKANKTAENETATSQQRPVIDQGKSASDTNQAQTGDHDINKELARYTCELAASTNRVADFTRWLAVATVFLIGVGFYQASIARGAARTQLRAYVSVMPRNLFAFGTRTPVEIVSVIKNSGQTPAYNVRGTAGIFLDQYPLPPDTPFPKSIQTPTATEYVLSLGGESEFRVKAPFTLDAAQLAEAASATNYRLYIIGKVTYRDAFKIDRETTFCMSVSGSGLVAMAAGVGGPGPHPLVWNHEPQHNTAT